MFAPVSKGRLHALAAALFVISTSTAGADEPSRLIHAVEAAGHHVPPVATLRSSCDDDMLCIARFLKERVGEGAALVPDEHKSQDGKSSWQKSASFTDLGGGKIALHRFDAAALATKFKADKVAVIDLRQTSDSDLDQMRRVAGLFLGDVGRAFTVGHIGGREIDWTISTQRQGLLTRVPEIWVGPETGVVAVLFAVLLQKHAKADIRGEPTQRSAFMTTDIPVTHGWKLRVPHAKLAVPGFELSNGIVPQPIEEK